jgi:hypothetical protein
MMQSQADWLQLLSVLFEHAAWNNWLPVIGWDLVQSIYTSS